MLHLIENEPIETFITMTRDLSVSSMEMQLDMLPKDSTQYKNLFTHIEEIKNMSIEQYMQYFEDNHNRAPYENIIFRFTAIALDVFVDTKSLSKAN